MRNFDEGKMFYFLVFEIIERIILLEIEIFVSVY